MEFTSIVIGGVVGGGLVVGPLLLLQNFLQNKWRGEEASAHRQETRALLQRLGVPVPQQLPTPYKPPAEPKGRWLSDPEGLDPIFIPAED